MSMKKLGLISISAAMLTGSLYADVLTVEQVSTIKSSNKILMNPNINIKKGEVNDNLTHLKIGIMFQTQKGVSERDAEAFIVKAGEKEYTFLGGGYDSDGEKLSLPINTELVEAGVAWTVGEGNETLSLVTNPSCPWCQKFEKKAHDSDFFKKYKVNVYLMPFHEGATEKSYWVLDGKTDAEKSERFKSVMLDNNTTWKDFKPTPEQKASFDETIKKSLDAAKEIGASGTPAVFDSKYTQIQNWPSLME
jgi:hypothetical protein